MFFKTYDWNVGCLLNLSFDEPNQSWDGRPLRKNKYCKLPNDYVQEEETFS